MKGINVINLKKTFKVQEKKHGFKESVKGLFNRKYKYIDAVNGISFKISEGEIVGFIGLNGAGKSTTLKMLSGLIYPTHGNIDVVGFNPWNKDEQFLKTIGLVMGQKSQLWWDIPGMESFLIEKEIYGIEETIFNETLNELIELMDVRHILNTPVRNLSLGERMKLEIILTLLHKPKVLFLDEPTVGLDIIAQKKIRTFIKEYNAATNNITIITSHNVKDIENLCNRIIIIDKGKLLYDGSIDYIIKSYALEKNIIIKHEKDFDMNKLQKYGHIKSTNNNKTIISVEIDRLKKVKSSLINEELIKEISIQNMEFEEILEKFLRN